jgi:hypothetical protein
VIGELAEVAAREPDRAARVRAATELLRRRVGPVSTLEVELVP